MNLRPGNRTDIRVWQIDQDRGRWRSDHVVTEEPLEIRLITGGERRTVGVTMRTPGNDFELVAGFLYCEGVTREREDIVSISYCVDPVVGEEQRYNIVNVALRSGSMPDLAPLERHFFTTSACGVCGKASLDALRMRQYPAVAPGPEMPVDVLYRLPDVLRSAQGLFEKTGGLHAAALFNSSGNLIQLREDVGRHNALDKVIGWALLEGELPLSDSVLLVSGRTSFEIMQKSLAAGIPIVCGISAPSSLAVELAREFGVTLIGFLRGERCNVYAAPDRIRVTSNALSTQTLDQLGES